MLSIVFYILLSIGMAVMLWELVTGRLFPWQTKYKSPSEKREERLAEERWHKMTPQQREEERQRKIGEELVSGHGCGPVPRKLLLSHNDLEYKKIFSPDSPFPTLPASETHQWTIKEEALMVQAQHLIIHANPAWSSRASKILDILKELKKSAHSPRESATNLPKEQLVTTPVNGEFLLQLCSRMNHALSIRDERSAYGFMESVRAMASAVLSSDGFAEVNKTAVFIEADMQNGLWENAMKSGRLFTEAVSQAIQKTNTRN